MRKPSMAKVVVDVKYIGFDMDPVWVVGYGLDYNEVKGKVSLLLLFLNKHFKAYRTLPFIGELSKAAIEKGKK